MFKLAESNLYLVNARAFTQSEGEPVNGEKVQAQHSDFYGGWITSRVVGPFKGGAGTQGW